MLLGLIALDGVLAVAAPRVAGRPGAMVFVVVVCV
jgi:hypothetical protein